MTTTTASEPIIQVQDLTKRFGDKTVVSGLSLSVNQGEIYGFLGPNGSGKTTFIRMLTGLLTPDGGQGTCMGWDIIHEPWRIKPHVGYMAQRFSLYEDLSVTENLDFIARVYRIQKRSQAVARVIERMGLGPYAKRLAGALSGGWKQRLALSACMLHEPKLLLLDEPTAGVDPMARRDFWDEVHKLSGEGVTALISTHYMDEAERCHRLGYIAYGKLLTTGTADEIVAAQGLTTWEVAGPDLHALSDQLKDKPGVQQVVAFGTRLHVSGQDAQALDQTVDAFRKPELAWRKIDPSLEEVFISLMRASLKDRENGGAAS